MAKWVVAGLLALVIAGLGGPALAQCPAAGSLTVSEAAGMVHQVWIRAFGAFSVAPPGNGSSVWFATQDGSADTILVLINQTNDVVTPVLTLRDLEGNIVAEGEFEVGALATFTLSIASAVAPTCEPE